MTRLRRHLFLLLLSPLWLLSACASKTDEASSAAPAATPDRPAWMPAPLTSMQYSSRIGIMTALKNEITHVHAGTAGIGNFRNEYKAGFDLPGYTTESLRKAILSNTPYQPLLVKPSAKLMRDSGTWQKSWNEQSQSFGNDWGREFDAVIKQNQLKLLIIVAATEMDDGMFGTGQTLVGSGLYTRSFLGREQKALFSTIRFYRIGGQPGKLLQPVSSRSERFYADLPGLPDPGSIKELSPTTLAPVEKALRDMIDQKVGAFISLMK